MKYTLTVEDESFGDQKIIMQLPLDGSEDIHKALQTFSDALLVSADAIMTRQNRTFTNDKRIDGIPTQEQVKFHDEVVARM